MQRLIVLLTDFGLSDPYAGVMKGVILNLNPQAQLVDLTHSIQPQNVRQAAFALMNSYRYFPEGTIFLVVVDPGVGTDRRPIAVRAGGYIFVAPDNGVLSYVLHEWNDYVAFELTNQQYQLSDVSFTFHGRDIFAPAAAHISQGIAVETFGAQLTDVMVLPAPELVLNEGQWIGEVVHIDHFGNVITSLGQLRWLEDRLTLMPRLGDFFTAVSIQPESCRLVLNGHTVEGIQRAYGDVERGTLLSMVGSNGYLEVAINQGHAASRLDVEIGDQVTLNLE